MFFKAIGLSRQRRWPEGREGKERDEVEGRKSHVLPALRSDSQSLDTDFLSVHGIVELFMQF